MLHGANPRMCSAKCEPIWSLFSVCVVWDTSTPLKALVGTLTPWERGYVNAPASEVRFSPNRLSLSHFHYWDSEYCCA